MRRVVKILAFLVVFFGISVLFGQDTFAADWEKINSKAIYEGVYGCASAGNYPAEWQTSQKGEYVYTHANEGDDDAVKLPYGKTDIDENYLNCKNVLGGRDGYYRVSIISGLMPLDIKRSTNSSTLGSYFAESYTPTNGDSGGARGSTAKRLTLRAGNCPGSNRSGVFDIPGANIHASVINLPAVAPDADGKTAVYDWGSDIIPGSGEMEGTICGNTFKINVGYDTINSGGGGELLKVSFIMPNAKVGILSTDTGEQYVEDMEESVSSGTGKWWYGSSQLGDGATFNFYAQAQYNSRNDTWAQDKTDLQLTFSQEEETIPDGEESTSVYVTMRGANNGRGDAFARKFTYDVSNGNTIGLWKIPSVNARLYNLLALSDQEVYDLYTYYIAQVLNYHVACEGEDDFEAHNTGEFDPIKWKKNEDGTFATCIIYGDRSKDPSELDHALYGVEKEQRSERYMHFVMKIDSLNDITDVMNNLNFNEITTLTGGTATYSDGGGSENSGSVEAEPNCLNSGALGSLGWWLCPLLDGLSSATEAMYDGFVKPALQVEPKLFNVNTVDANDDVDSGVRQAWAIFQNIANIAFMILFLVVIISQLTGVGIDNYGIKKILPKLIIAAILINLSYIICLALIDLSNIVGNGIQNMMNSLADGLTMTITSDDFGRILVNGEVFDLRTEINEAMNTGTITGAALIGIFGMAFWTEMMTMGTSGIGDTIILLLILGVLTVAGAIFFLFILLGAREAAIIILTMLSPLAFVCLILPNTKKIFDRWMKIGWGLLLVYPICGLLVGGGNFVSRALLVAGAGAEGFFPAFIAMIVGVVPIFLIPTVLKSSFAAMGTFGAKLSGLLAYGKNAGRKIGGNAVKTVQTTNTGRRLLNAAGRKFSVTNRGRRKAFESTVALETERAMDDAIGGGGKEEYKKRLAQRIEATTTANEHKENDQAVENMRRSQESNGINMAVKDENGNVTVKNVEYSFKNLVEKLRQIMESAKMNKGEMSDASKLEMAAILRGLASKPGGGGKIGKIIRDSAMDDGNGGKTANSAFMSALGEIYARDSAFASKLNEKDMGASIYAEKFLPGASGTKSTFGDFQKEDEYGDEMRQRIKNHAVGLSQGGKAVEEYIEGLDQAAVQQIRNDENLYNSLDRDVRERFDSYASGEPRRDENGKLMYDYSNAHPDWKVTGPTRQEVVIYDRRDGQAGDSGGKTDSGSRPADNRNPIEESKFGSGDSGSGNS